MLFVFSVSEDTRVFLGAQMLLYQERASANNALRSVTAACFFDCFSAFSKSEDKTSGFAFEHPN
jgi:hypothetical protein